MQKSRRKIWIAPGTFQVCYSIPKAIAVSVELGLLPKDHPIPISEHNRYKERDKKRKSTGEAIGVAETPTAKKRKSTAAVSRASAAASAAKKNTPAPVPAPAAATPTPATPPAATTRPNAGPTQNPLMMQRNGKQPVPSFNVDMATQMFQLTKSIYEEKSDEVIRLETELAQAKLKQATSLVNMNQAKAIYDRLTGGIVPPAAPPTATAAPAAGPMAAYTARTRVIPVDLVSPDPRPATLSKHPRTLRELWSEYTIGLGGRKPAKNFTSKERTALKSIYCRRNIIWSLISDLIQVHKCSADIAIQKIYNIYGISTPVTKIIQTIRKDRNNGHLHPDLSHGVFAKMGKIN